MLRNEILKLLEGIIADKPDHVGGQLTGTRHAGLLMTIVWTSNELNFQHLNVAPNWLFFFSSTRG
jgi:hypothetical protein